MSTANFNSNQLGFPLYVHDNIYVKVCPECGAWNNAEDDTCYECGASLDGAEERYDDVQEEWLCDDVKSCMDEINKELAFFQVGLESGYYVGVQFTVGLKKTYYGNALDPEEMDNEDAHYYYDCCRSVMLRKYERERRKLGKKLAQLAEDFGFEEIVCIGHFSNGEAIYERAGTVKAAACAV